MGHSCHLDGRAHILRRCVETLCTEAYMRADRWQFGLTVCPFNLDGDIRTLADIEAEVVAHAVLQFRGNVTAACQALCVGRSTYYRWARGR